MSAYEKAPGTVRKGQRKETAMATVRIRKHGDEMLQEQQIAVYEALGYKVKEGRGPLGDVFMEAPREVVNANVKRSQEESKRRLHGTVKGDVRSPLESSTLEIGKETLDSREGLPSNLPDDD